MIRGMAKTEPITVNLRAGTYPPKRAIFRTQDSGTATNPITYQSMPGETAFIDGLAKVDASSFALASGASLNKLPTAARGNTYTQVITDPAMIELLQHPHALVSHNQRPQFLATIPDQGFLTVDNKQILGTGTGTYENPLGPVFTIKENINFALLGAELARGGRQAYTDGYLGTEFGRRRIPLVRMGSTGGRSFVLKDKTAGVFATVAVSRFRVANVLSGLDGPGEWFFDKLDNRLYFWPLSGSISSSDSIGVTGGGEAFVIVETEHMAIKNIVFRNLGGASQNGAVIDIQRGKNVEVGGCSLRSISLPLAPIAMGPDSANNLITSCDLYDNGRGIILGGGSFNATSVNRAVNIVENCHFALWLTRHGSGNAVSVSGAGNVFRDNLCHNSGSQAIIHRGVDHYFARNELFNIGYEEGDGGAAYTGAELFSFGNTFRHNFVHHLINIPGLLGRAAFFSDDYDAGEEYDANVFYKCGEAAVKLNAGSGHTDTVTANVFIENLNGVSLLGRPETYNRVNDEALRFLREDPNANRKENYLGRAEQIIGDFANNATGEYNTSWNNSFWAQRYPLLRNMLSGGRLGMFPSQVRVYDNGFQGNGTNFKRSSGFGAELRSQTLGNGNFVDPTNLNFKFTSVPTGMKAIPFESIGLKTNSYRSSVPNKTTYRRAVRDRWINNNGRPGGSYNSNTANNLVYYNTGALIVPGSQSGLSVREGDAGKNQPGGNNGGGNNGGGNNGGGDLAGADVGNTSPSGITTSNGSGSYSLQGAGADIWGSADAFHFASEALTAPTGTLTARIASFTNTNVWAKAGVHYRDSNAAGSKNVGVYVRPDGQIAMQWRSSTNGASSWHGTLVGNTGFAKWVRLSKNGNSYTGAWSPNGTAWTDIRTVTVGMGNDNIGGLAVTSHANGTLATAEFTNYSSNWSGGSSGPASITPPSGLTQLEFRHSSKCVDNKGGTSNQVEYHQWTCGANANRNFTFTSLGGGYYSIKSEKSNRCLDVAGGSTADGGTLHQWDCSSSNINQSWKLEAIDGTWFQLVSRRSEKCVDVLNSGTSNSDRILQKNCDSTKQSQQLRFK